jgi:membrane peptidoglycan carboxypeptidase
VRVISERTSETMRKLMRLVVTDGSGKGADVPGYFVGGKTGTAQKTGPRGGYLEDKRIAAFVGAFPMNQPRYAFYVMVDEPKPNARSHGYATAGWVAAPAAGAVIRRVAPILGLVPESPERQPQVQASIAIPLQPGRPAGSGRTPGQVAPPAPGSPARSAAAAAPGGTAPTAGSTTAAGHGRRRLAAGAAGRPAAARHPRRRRAADRCAPAQPPRSAGAPPCPCCRRPGRGRRPARDPGRRPDPPHRAAPPPSSGALHLVSATRPAAAAPPGRPGEAGPPAPGAMTDARERPPPPGRDQSPRPPASAA